MADVVNIFFAGDDPDDHQFAQAIAEGVQTFAKPVLHDIDKYDRQDLLSDDRPEAYWGVFVFVLSSHALAPTYNRRKLLRATPRVGVTPGETAFYICRGVKSTQIGTRYPDLAPLLDNIMIGEETDLPILQQELREYLRYLKEQQGKGVGRAVFKLIVWIPIASLSILLSPVSMLLRWLSYPALPYLLYTAVITPRSAWFENALAALLVYGFGNNIAKLPPLDFWPYLGPRWKIPYLPSLREVNRHAAAQTAFTWLGTLSFPARRPLDAECSPDDLKMAYQVWLGRVRRTQIWQIVPCFAAMIGAVILASDSTTTLLVGLLALVVGLFFPSMITWGGNLLRNSAYIEKGLTDAEIARTEKVLAAKPSRLVSVREAEEHHVLTQTFYTDLAQRHWTRQSDRVFISHMWKDDEDYPAAHELAEHFRRRQDIHYFFDKHHLQLFTAWRAEIVRSLLPSTHVFVVIGPNILQGKVVFREIKTSLLRWYVELIPAIICVVEPEVAQTLLESADLPDELRLILLVCPCMTLEDIRQAYPINYLVEQRRRQGLLRDWQTLIFPETMLDHLEFYGGPSGEK
ncbi:MAG: hypothetical protein BroJett018_48350 [Chloroflexota bacterium]|nr:TIR domain-containing protein [Chloroflexota bacterium]NOG65875.1 toll/interleukin-1 receptor domain-containing protein [Chloroflexota bacterium]GIK67041.1 MAG: hypothetical protein BroJett018_48350 [Chloroflexota bacterium]